MRDQVLAGARLTDIAGLIRDSLPHWIELLGRLGPRRLGARCQRDIGVGRKGGLDDLPTEPCTHA